MFRWGNGLLVIRLREPRTKFGNWIGEKVHGKTLFGGNKWWDIFYVVVFSAFAYKHAFITESFTWFALNMVFVIASAIRLGKRGSAE